MAKDTKLNRARQIRAIAEKKKSRIEEAGLDGRRVGKVSAATRRAQARRDAKSDAVAEAMSDNASPAPQKPSRKTPAATDPSAGFIVQVNTTNTVSGSEALETRVQRVVRTALSRFATRLTRVEVHLTDVNARKQGEGDKRCQIEARLAGLKPASVTANADTVDGALRSASTKMKRLLTTHLGKR